MPGILGWLVAFGPGLTLLSFPSPPKKSAHSDEKQPIRRRSRVQLRLYEVKPVLSGNAATNSFKMAKDTVEDGCPPLKLPPAPTFSHPRLS